MPDAAFGFEYETRIITVIFKAKDGVQPDLQNFMISREEERVEQSWFEREAGTSDTAAAFSGPSDPKKRELAG